MSYSYVFKSLSVIYNVGVFAETSHKVLHLCGS